MVAAFFDVDHTMLPGTSVERLFVRDLWHRGGLGLRDLARTGASILGSGRGSLARRIKSNKTYLAGKPVADVAAHAKPFVMEVIRPR
ncbi:MAG TPA: HAD-IB family hydrolase, partial [Nitrospiria bacterium]|nr:HAD-IB family hydrolase [Nitrospiria bacterium]